MQCQDEQREERSPDWDLPHLEACKADGSTGGAKRNTSLQALPMC